MGHDGVDGGAKREILIGDRFENSIDMRSVGAGNFAAMGVADEFPDDTLEDAFLVGHQDGLERGQVAHLAAVREFHGGLDRDLGEFDFLCERGSVPLDRELFNVAILRPLATNRVIKFKGETQRINPGMAAGTTLEFLML